MEKEKSDAALARIFDDPSIPFFPIGCANASSARAACVEHSGEVFRHDASMNVRVFLHDFFYTISSFINMASIYLRVDRSCVTEYQIVTCLFLR